MESIAVKNVKELQDTGKHWLEGLLGQQLQENQQVFIMLFTPGVEPDEAMRRLALKRMEETWRSACSRPALPRMRKLHGLDDTDIDAYVQAVQSAALMVNLPLGIPAAAVSKDPDDDPIIATAVAGHAEIVCTRDRHFTQPDVQKYCRPKN